MPCLWVNVKMCKGIMYSSITLEKFCESKSDIVQEAVLLHYLWDVLGVCVEGEVCNALNTLYDACAGSSFILSHPKEVLFHLHHVACDVGHVVS